MIGRTLSHFKILAKLGEGGMGLVYRAEDEALRRPVALKVLSGRLLAQPEHRLRFLREARAAAAVTHPHVATIYEVGEAEGVVFIAMELVEGKTLRELQGGKALPVKQAVRIAGEVAEAIVAAHASGVIHRDLKPDNIIVGKDRRAKVLDFGLAKLVQEAAGPGEVPSQADTISGELTKAGKVLGTASYMSPEQARGEIVDARSDLFSFGVTLYEMVTGWPPFRGRTVTDVLSAIIRDSVPPASHANPEVPAELDRILAACLEKDPAERYQHAEQLAVDLRRLGRELETGSAPSYKDVRVRAARGGPSHPLAWSLAGIVGVAVVSVAAWRILAPRGRVADERTVLVLPLEVQGQAEGRDTLGRAFAEAIAINLACSKSLKVLPVPEGGGPDQREVQVHVRDAFLLGAGRLLTGSLVREGATIQATLSLVNTVQNRILWGVQKRTSEDELPGLAESVARAALAEMGAETPKVYEYFLYLAGTPAMAASPDFGAALGALRRHEIANAMTATARLIETYPDEPDARLLRLVAISFHRSSPLTAEDWSAFEEARSALDRVDPRNPWSEKWHADWLKNSGRLQEAIPIYDRILARDDLSPAARANVVLNRGMTKTYLGHLDEGLADVEEARRLNPADDWVYSGLSGALGSAGRNEEALAKARIAVALNPGSYQNTLTLGDALYRLGRWEEAVPPYARACEINHDQYACAAVALALARGGHGEAAAAAAERAAELPDSRDGVYLRACYAAATSDRKGAFRLLRRAADLGLDDADFIAQDPELRSLRGEREFEAIVAEVRKRATRP